jgi:hypothetical protein
MLRNEMKLNKDVLADCGSLQYEEGYWTEAENIYDESWAS